MKKIIAISGILALVATYFIYKMKSGHEKDTYFYDDEIIGI